MKKILFLFALTLGLVSCGTVGNNTDMINPDAEYLYFFGATCPHCQELNKQIKDQDIFSQVSVEKREVYFNDTNRELFEAKKTELGVSEREGGVPFVYDTVSGEYAVGVDKALALFKNRLNDTQRNKVVEVVPVTGGETSVQISE